ncbi:MAG: hypothetical protein KG029_08620 [Bacteroidetes bacterium]|nr:hypothetical protein [Bacteroidota bacterium]
MRYLKILNVPVYGQIYYGLDKAFAGWHNFEKPGLKLTAFDDSPIGPDSAGQPVLVNVGDEPVTKYFNGTGGISFTPLLQEIFGLPK